MSTNDSKRKVEIVKNCINSYPDFPKPGVLFRDIFSVLKNPTAFSALRSVLVEHVKQFKNVECIVGLESRGFIVGPIIALDLNIPFVPIRKKGKLPGTVETTEFELEYGKDAFEIQAGSVSKGQKIVVVDDLLATGGSLVAATKLLRLLGADVVECLVIMELVALRGRDKINAPVFSLIQY